MNPQINVWFLVSKTYIHKRKTVKVRFFVKQNDSEQISKHPLSVYSCWRSDPETRSAAR